MDKHTIILSISSLLFSMHLYAETVTPINNAYSEEGFKAAAYIITKKYIINNITEYCSEIVEKDIALTAKNKWIKTNEIFYIAARMKDEHYINYINKKHGSDVAELKKIESEKIYTKRSDGIINNYFNGTKTRQEKIDRCNYFIDELNSGIQDIIVEKDISDDLEKLRLFVEKEMYNK